MDRSMSSRHHQPSPNPTNPHTLAAAPPAPSSRPSTASKETVKRKPVPGSTSSSPATYQNPSPFTSNDISSHQSNTSISSISIPPLSASNPSILPRDLDQYASLTHLLERPIPLTVSFSLDTHEDTPPKRCKMDRIRLCPP